MNSRTYESAYEKLGKDILSGRKVREITLKGKKYKFDYTKEEFIETALKSGWPLVYEDGDLKNPSYYGTLDKVAQAYEDSKIPYINHEGKEDRASVQSTFISDFQSDFCLNSGGFGSGKSTALYVKLVLLLKCFPGNRVLMGRKTLSDIDRAVLPELFDLMPPTWYEHRVKDGLININNGSQIILFGLDAMQSGSVADIKKAQQKLKSLNLGAYFIDQLEEVEYEVFEVLNSRLRRVDIPFRQGNMDCNPANFWAYHQFKLNEMWNGEGWVPNPSPRNSLLESSMLHNPHLPWDYIRKQLSMGQDYKRRFVKGIWDTSSLTKGNVFAKENINFLESLRKAPLAVEEGCEIYEQPRDLEYRMGVDPSEGVVDPSSITVISSEGRKVAKFNGMVPIQGLADKVKFLYYKYHKPLIIPESNSSGTALIREIRDLRIYRRKHTEYKTDIETEKLGFRMSWDSKSQIIDHFQKLLRDKIPKIYDKKTIEEMKTFVWSNEATHQGAGAVRGFHDDDVMSTLLAFWDFTPHKSEEMMVARQTAPKKRSFQYF